MARLGNTVVLLRRRRGAEVVLGAPGTQSQARSCVLPAARPTSDGGPHKKRKAATPRQESLTVERAVVVMAAAGSALAASCQLNGLR